MKTTVFAILAIVCIGIVGLVEDPCSTEGLPAGCMDEGTVFPLNEYLKNVFMK